MGKFERNNKKGEASYRREKKEVELRDGSKPPLIVLSFMNFDQNQGQSFEQWQKDELLALAIQKLRVLCGYTIAQAVSQSIIKIYPKDTFPPESEFTHPKYLPQSIQWCSIRLGNKPRVIGYFEDNVFHVVFLDKDHEFWISEKKNT